MLNKLKITLILILLFLLPYIAFWQLWTSNLNDKYILTGDVTEATYPLNYFYAKSIWEERSLPLWNPYAQSGYPTMGDFQTAFFYPLDILQNLLFRFRDKKGVFDFFQLYEKKVILHLSLAGLFMFILMRKGFQLRTISSFIAAVIFMFNQSIIQYLEAYQPMVPIVWLPLIFLFLWRYYLTRRVFYSVACGISLSLALLSNAIQAMYYLCLLLGLIVIFLIISQFRNRQLNLKVILGWLSIFLIGFGIASIQLLPLYEFLTRHSIKAGYTNYTFSLSTPISFKGLILNYLIPFNPCCWHSGYIGILSLFLVLVGAIFYKHRLKKFLLFLIPVIWIISAGHYFFLNEILYLSLPGFGAMHLHGRMIIYQIFFLAVLAGFGMEYLNSTLSKREKKILFKIFLCFTGLILILFIGITFQAIHIALSTQRNPFVRIIRGIDGLAMLDWIDQRFFLLLFCALSLIILWSRLYLFLKRRIINILVVGIILLDLLSVFALTKSSELAPMLPMNAAFEVWPFLRDVIMPRLKPENSLDEIVKGRSSGYHLVNLYSKECIYGGYVSTVNLKRYYQYLAYADAEIVRLETPGYLRYVKDLSSPQRRPQLLKILTGQRAYVVPKFIVESDRRKILERLNDIDVHREIILEETPDIIKKEKGIIDTDGEGKVKFTKFSNNTVEMDVSLPWEYGFLLYIDNWYPGWKAYVDGKEVKVYRANFTFKAIVVPTGEHKVRFSFTPLLFKIGIIITISTLIASLIIILRSLR